MKFQMFRYKLHHMILLLILSCMIICLTGISVSGQAVTFEHFSVREGVSQSEIKCMLQDSEGYLWIGTQNGLNKYDGYSFVNYFYDPSDSNSISNSWIFDICEDPDGNLWLGTKGGLNKYNKKSGHFSRIEYKTDSSLIEDYFVYGLYADETSLYIHTPPVLTILNLHTGRIETYTNNFKHAGAAYDIGLPVIKSSDGKLWLGSQHGLALFDLGEKQFTNFVHDDSDHGSISNDHVMALAEDNKGNILIGTEIGLNIYSKETQLISRIFRDINDPNSLSHNTIRSIIQDRSGNLWIGTGGGGLNKISYGPDGSATFTHFRSGSGLDNYISHDIVFSLLEDNSSNLWIGTIAGIDKTDLKKKNIRTYRKSDDPGSIDLLDNLIASVYKDGDGMLWVGNWGKGLNIVDLERNNVIHYAVQSSGILELPDNYVHVIFKDSRSRIWIGTRNGISIFREGLNDFISVQDYFGAEAFDIFNDIRVYCIIEDHQGKIWIGTGNGVSILDLETRQQTSLKVENDPPLEISSNLVYSLLEDRDNEVWIATSGGLDRYKPEEGMMHHYRNDPGSINTLIDNFTISLCEDSLGNIWIGTSSGANRFSKSDSAFSYFSVNDGLPSNIIYDIIEDDKDRLWFSTGGGLAMADPGLEEAISFMVIDEFRGMEFNLKAVYRADDGELFFGSIDGLVSFYPDSLSENTYIPPVRITSIIKESGGLRQEMNAYEKQLVLSYQDYSFTVEFSALDYTNPEKNRYSYQMEGVSDLWRDIGSRRFVLFTNLPPGQYTFRVKGTNNDGVWNEAWTGIKIKILPPWWRSKYAYGAYIILIIIILVIIVMRRERKFRIETKRLESKVRERTAEISLQKEKVEESELQLKELNATKDKFFSILAHDLKNPFSNLYSMSELISVNYESMDEEEKILTLKKINKSAEFIYNLLENLLTWSKSQRGRIDYTPGIFNLSTLIQVNLNLHRIHAGNKGISLESEVEDEIMAYGDREMINTVLRNLVNNAVKFTAKGGSVVVSVQENEDMLQVTVKDRGTGISEENIQKLFHIDLKFKTTGTGGETGTGLGLILCKDFVEKNGGRIWCESQEGTGSSFHFTVPARERPDKFTAPG